jgi:crotonobetainyl-CoA:carnitine CoA-transferase CaiB-like acyl-CoA transferase
MQPALDGLKVIDFSQGGAGPYCAQLLADFGASVVKIEPPRGDWAREMGVRSEALGMSATFAAFNRSKRGLCLDLGKPQAVEVARRLALQADVVVEAFRPGVMKRLGLGADELRAAAPRLIYCAISGFGQTGPNIDLPASDSVMQAYGGLMSLIGEADGPPFRVPNIVSDMLAGTNGFASVLLAIIRRERTGEGGVVGTSLLDSIVGFQASIVSEYLMTGKPPVRRGNSHPLIAASGVFAAADGRIAFTVLDHYWRPFCEAMDLAALCEDPRFATSSARHLHRGELQTRLSEAAGRHTVADLLERLGALGVLCAPVQDYPTLVSDPQVRHNQLLSWMPVRGGEVPMVRSPMSIDGPAADWTPPPSIGEHSVEVLSSELGMDRRAIDELLSCRAVIAAPASPPSKPPGEAS